MITPTSTDAADAGDARCPPAMGLPPPLAVSVVVPVYDGAATLPELVARLAAVLAARAPRSEILLVNDGSRDASWQVILELAHAHATNGLGPDRPRVHGIDLMRNYGQHNALLCGIRAAAGGVVGTMDDDLHAPPAARARGDPAAARRARRRGGRGLWHAPRRAARVAARRRVARHQDGARGRHGSRRRPPRQRLPRLPHRAASGLRAVRQPLRVDRRAADLGHNPLRRGAGAPRAPAQRALQLHLPDAGAARPQHGHRLQRRAAAAGEPRRLRLDPAGDRRARVCRRPLPDPGHQRPRLPVPRLGHRHLLRRSAVHARHHRRVPGADALPADVAPRLQRAPGHAGRPGLKAPPEPCELLAWDSEHFGRRIGRVRGGRLTRDTLALVERWVAREAVECVYFLADASDPDTAPLAEEAGFRLVDVRVTLERRLRGAGGATPVQAAAVAVSVRQATAADAPELRRLAA